jgi:hypothetical protein
MSLEEVKKHSIFQPVSVQDVLKANSSPILYPQGWRHFLSLPTDFATIIKFLKDQGALLDGPLPPAVRNDLPAVPTFICKWKNGISSTGYDEHPILALKKAISEGIERLITFDKQYVLDESIRVQKIDKDIINPYEKSTFFVEQEQSSFSYNWNEKLFTPCKNLLTSEIKYLPDEYIFWGGGDKELYSSTTNGGGAHINRELAALSAIHEYVERDAFLVHWLTKKAPILLDLKSLGSSNLNKIIENLTSRDIELYIGVLDSGLGIPTFISCLFDNRGTPPAFAVAGATDGFNYETSIIRALLESQFILQEVLDMAPGNGIKMDNIKPFTNKNVNRKERLNIWKGEWIREELAWLTQGEVLTLAEVRIRFPELKEGKSKEIILAQHIKDNKKDANIYVYYPKSSLSAKLGLVVAKVYIENLLVFYLKESVANINTKRIRDFTTRGGNLYYTLNPFPHPYP